MPYDIVSTQEPRVPICDTMPASQIEWATYNQPRVFSVYGTKRKVDEEDAAVPRPSQAPCPQELPQPKRLCAWSDGTHNNLVNHQMELLQQQGATHTTPSVFPDPQRGMEQGAGSDPNMQDVNQNHEAMEDQNLVAQQQFVNPALHQVMSQQLPRVPSPWPSPQKHTNIIPPTSDRVMDLNGETYSSMGLTRVTAEAEMEVACMSMDSDFTPNTEQYNHRTGDSQHQCSDGGHVTSVRCFCKPSWEGVMDLKPYISDVY